MPRKNHKLSFRCPGLNFHELDKKTDFFLLGSVLYTSTPYQTSYGYISRTPAGDEDGMNVLILNDEAFEPLHYYFNLIKKL